MPVLKLPGLSASVNVASIIYVEGSINYAWLHTTNQPKCLVAVTLKGVHAQLPGFIRIHKSWLINPAHVAQVSLEGSRCIAIQLTNGNRMVVARRRMEKVRQQLEKLVQLLD